MNLPTPKAWQEPTKVSAKTNSKGHTKLTSRVDMSAEVAGAGLCPECRKPMETGFANGIECWICHPDRVAIPLPDKAAVEGRPDAVTPAEQDYAAFGPTTSQGPV